MTGRHYALLAGCLTGISGMMLALPHWEAAMSPQFIGGALGVFGATLGAIYSDRPERRE